MKYSEQDLKDEYEQAVKRKGKLYAEGYVEGLKDAQNKALSIPNVINWVAVSDEKPNDDRWVLTSNIIDDWVDRAEFNEEQGYWWNGKCKIIPSYWWNGKCKIIPTHWAELPKPPCL